MKLDLEEVLETPKFQGEILYVCAYVSSAYGKPLQKVEPTSVAVISMEDFKQSGSIKNPYKAKNVLLKYDARKNKINFNNPIAPYDATSKYKISVFTEMEECKQHYLTLI